MSTHTTLELQTGKAARLLKAGQLNVVKAQPGAVYRVVAVRPGMSPALLDNVLARRENEDLVLQYGACLSGRWRDPAGSRQCRCPRAF